MRVAVFDSNVDNITRYVRNKVRTSSKWPLRMLSYDHDTQSMCSEYTIVTFIPKNLTEQFYR